MNALSSKPDSPQILLIDEDDTLWENNIYFERAIANFISFLNHQEFSTEQVSEVLNDAYTYLQIVAKLEVRRPHTWMVGNSRMSDICPALAARLNAGFVPHDQTWILEHEEFSAPLECSRLIVVEHFGQLTEYF